MMLNIGMKVEQYYSDLNYVPPRPHKNVKYQDRMIGAGTSINSEKWFFQGTVMRKLGMKSPRMHCSWITCKHHCPPQCIRIVVTQVGPFSRRSSKIEH